MADSFQVLFFKQRFQENPPLSPSILAQTQPFSIGCNYFNKTLDKARILLYIVYRNHGKPRMSKIMTLKEVSEFFHVTPPTIRKLMNCGLGHYRIGRQYRFSLEDHILPFLVSHSFSQPNYKENSVG